MKNGSLLGLLNVNEAIRLHWTHGLMAWSSTLLNRVDICL
jgi:hypothetical protein